MSNTGFPREVREIVIVDEDHQKAIRNLFLGCKGRLVSFHLHGKQWRFESDTLPTSPIPPPGGWGTTFVTLREVLREEKQAFAVDEQAILRGQWSGDQIYPPVAQSPPPASGGGSTTVIVAAVRKNQVAIQLAAFSLLASLDAKIDALRAERSNSEDIAQYENLRRLVEEFLAAASSPNEGPIVEKTLSLADGIKCWWTKDHVNICSKALNIGLFAGGLSICGLAGAYGVNTASIVTVGALIGGKNVADSLAALAKMLPGKKD